MFADRTQRNIIAEDNIERYLKSIAADTGLRAQNKAEVFSRDIKFYRNAFPLHNDKFWGLCIGILVVGIIIGAWFF